MRQNDQAWQQSKKRFIFINNKPMNAAEQVKQLCFLLEYIPS